MKGIILRSGTINVPCFTQRYLGRRYQHDSVTLMEAQNIPKRELERSVNQTFLAPH